MIKLFGQIRYHWQPELSWAIIYWSLTLMPFFIGLSLIYERTKSPQLVFVLVAVTIILIIFGCHRYFIIEPDSHIRIVSLNPFAKLKRLAIAEISKIEISKYRFSICLANGQRRTVFMRKWPKKYFLDALGRHPDFQGEVDLMDNFVRLDYFKAYNKPKKPLVED